MIPVWLQQPEDYAPRSDRDAFVDRSIRSFINLLARFRPGDTGGRDGIVFNPGVKVASTLVFILLVSLSQSFFFVILAGTLLLVILSVHPIELILKVFRTSLPVAVFTAVTLLPLALRGGSSNLVIITTKVAISVSAVKLLAATTDWGAISSALRVFFIPHLFILVLDITIRYIVALGELSLGMLHALKIRSVGRNADKAGSLSGIAGTLFLKSRDMAEDIYAAMECRGFIGTYRIAAASKLRAADFIPFAVVCLLVLAFFAAR